MNIRSSLCIILFTLTGISLTAQNIAYDAYSDGKGDTLKIILVGHSSLIFEYKTQIIHVDPFSNVADYSKLPKADLIILTHEHGDHLDKKAIEEIKTSDTQFILSAVCYDELGYGKAIKNGDKTSFESISIEAVPAYNIVHKRPDGEYYHPKGRGNGYVFTFGKLRVYVAADTENIPEMKTLKGVDIAFLPKNTPYTMTDEMFIDAAKTLSPRYLYPYHFSEFDSEKITKAINNKSIKILVRSMKNK